MSRRLLSSEYYLWDTKYEDVPYNLDVVKARCKLLEKLRQQGYTLIEASEKCMKKYPHWTE